MKKLRIGLVYIVSFCLVCFPILCNLEVYAAGKPQMRSSLSMKTGEQKILRVKGKQIKKIKYKSTNPKIVSVKKNGKVTAKSTGNAKIKATVTYFQNKKIRSMKLVCRVFVSEPKKEVNFIHISTPTLPTLDSPTPTPIPNVDYLYDLPDSMRREPKEVEALKKLIATQNAFGAQLEEDLDGESYVWGPINNGNDTLHLNVIRWNDSGLYGAVDFSPFPELSILECDRNYITELDTSGCKKLCLLHCNDNDLTSLDLSSNLKLEYFQCYGNHIKELDFGENNMLRTLYCADNEIEKLEISKLINLIVLYCWKNSIQELDISNNRQLLECSCGSNPLSELDISKNENLTRINIYSTNISHMEFTNHPMLTDLVCSFCPLTSLDVSGLPALSDFNCGWCSLYELDVSQNKMLRALVCSDNKITSLDVSHNPELKRLMCVSEVLSEVDVSNNPQLTELTCNLEFTKVIGLPPGCNLINSKY